MSCEPLGDLKAPKGTPPSGAELVWDLGEDRTNLGRKVDLVTEESLSPYVRPYVEKERVVLYDEG